MRGEGGCVRGHVGQRERVPPATDDVTARSTAATKTREFRVMKENKTKEGKNDQRRGRGWKEPEHQRLHLKSGLRGGRD